ncbi:MAG: BrnA antitoxin family protein [Mariprofundales bacterium]
MKNPTKIAKFSNEAEERQYWEATDTSGLFDWSQAKQAVFPNLKPSTKSISIRLPLSMLDKIRVEAHKNDIPYQSLIKVWLSERLDKTA